jgi:acetylornithine aminotransferase
MSAALMDTYKRLDLRFTHGEGVYLYDESGKRYLDAIAGIGVNALGHAHPAVTAAVAEQAGRLVHTSNLYHIAQQEELAHKLSEISGMERSFFGNSGAEANEAAIKLARLYGHQRGIDNPFIVVMEKAFHGRTMACLTATGNRKIQAGFEPLVSGFARAPFDDVDAVAKIAENNPNVVAILVEPIQGEGGINVPAEGYLSELRAICDDKEWLLMLDEVQSGNCRSGHWYACQADNTRPDVITTAKALANGVPIGVCMAHGPAASVFSQGNHGSTYGGNPLACAAALAVINTMESEGLAQRAAALGERIRTRFSEALSELSAVTDIRGRGLMIGVELSTACAELVEAGLARDILINVTSGNTIRLLPPLILSDAEADDLADRVIDLVRDFAAGESAAAASA